MRILVVIVTYNGVKWINECLNSVLNSLQVPDIYVIDNMSCDGTVAILNEEYLGKIILHESNENLGFGKGNNIGLKYALKHNYDYVFLLNQDAFLQENTLERLLEVAEKNKDYGILSPIHLDFMGDKLESYFSDFINLKHSHSFYADHIINKKIKDIYPIQFINAAAWLIPQKTLKEVGGFDPIFWHYGEDDNYCQRVLFHGYKIGVVSKSYVRHDSKIRINDNNYLFSTTYYTDFIKELQKKYGNLNYNFKIDILIYEKKKVIKDILRSIFTFKFMKAVKYSKKIKLLITSIPLIITSRNLNKNKGSNYINE